jgi:hypothetical protein
MISPTRFYILRSGFTASRSSTSILPKAEKLIEGMERLPATVESYERKLITVREDAIEVFEDADLAP